MQKIIIWTIAIIVVVGAGLFALNLLFSPSSTGENLKDEMQDQDSMDESDEQMSEDEDQFEPQTVLGKSVQGNDIIAYHFGTGETSLLFVGGIHGGYSWNTSLVAFELIEYLGDNPEVIPENISVTVVPVLNPDGLEDVVGTTGRFEASDVSDSEDVRVAGRFNANEVDLNRNFDCDWEEEATWQGRDISGGSEPFSEPEAAAMRDFVDQNEPDAVVVWYAAAGGVFASNCHGGVLPETSSLTNLYAEASDYQAYEEFDFYEITGDMVNWLSKQDIPAISVLLTNHEGIEWDKNKAGIDAMLEYYSESE